MSLLEDCAAETYRKRSYDSWFLGSSTWHDTNACSLFGPCSYVDVAMVQAAIARNDRGQRRHGLGCLSVEKMTDFCIRYTVWSTLRSASCTTHVLARGKRRLVRVLSASRVWFVTWGLVRFLWKCVRGVVQRQPGWRKHVVLARSITWKLGIR